MLKNQIRNFAIIAHVDHGKSTLADRFLEITGTVDKKVLANQYLDTNPISRERGITIKLAPVRMKYKIPNFQNHLEFVASDLEFTDSEFILNLIDTPGHVDFSYEVSRSLSACEGTILLVDATQGVQAQTLAHGRLAQKLGLTIIPVINKIDLLNTKIEEIKNDLSQIFGFPTEEILLISAKTGQGVPKLLETIAQRVSPPPDNDQLPLRALIFDSVYDEHQGVIAYVRLYDGMLSVQDKQKRNLHFLSTKISSPLIDFGYFAPNRTPAQRLTSGEVGYVVTGLKDPTKVRIGDTITTGAVTPLPGYQELKPMVFLGFYPKDSDDFPRLEDALSKLHLNDSSFIFSPENSAALGNGYRLGCLGVLHAEIVKERLFREFNLDLIATTPNVPYRFFLNGKPCAIKNVQDLPSLYEKLEEPWIKITIFVPQEYLGNAMTLCQEKRAKLLDLVYLRGGGVETIWEMPLSEMIVNFYDKLKSVSSGFANLDYEFIGFREFKGTKLTVLLNHEPIDSLSLIAPLERMEREARIIAEKLKTAIPRQQFEVRIQVANNSRILASETVSPFRKDVLQKLYGGDRTRKDKLLEAQRKGKKKMKQIGKISLPDDVFMSFYKI